MKFNPIEVDLSIIPDWQRDMPDAHLQAWFMGNEAKDTMIYKKASESSIMFLRDQPTRMFYKNIEKIEVISTHTSKSIKLPVVHIVLKNGTEFIVRDNFHDFKITVLSPDPLGLPKNLFSLDKDISTCYCEGFEDEWVLPNYTPENNKNFTVEVYGNYELFTLWFLINEHF